MIAKTVTLLIMDLPFTTFLLNKEANLEKSKLKESKKFRGYCTFYPKLTYFVLYLKTINTFLKNSIYASYGKLFKELENGIEILGGHADFKVWIKHMIGSIT